MKKLALLFVCALALSGCATIVADQEVQLDAAGFRAVPADTPELQAMLTALPARQFVRGVSGDLIIYTYADPLVCDCLYVGSDGAYLNYRHRRNLAGNYTGWMTGGGATTNNTSSAAYNSFSSFPSPHR
jgi:hypothetical protein